MSSPAQPLRVGVLLSGTGRTLENLLRWERGGDLLATIVCVASNKPAVRGIEVARRAKLPVEAFQLSSYPSRQERDRSMLRWVRSYRPDLVALAGYLALLDLGPLEGIPVLNIHPALLPRFGGAGFYGDRVHEAVLAAGEVESGCTVHVVDEEFDRGPILAQRHVPVRPTDDVRSLARRVFEAECHLYPETINRIARGDLDPGGTGGRAPERG